VILIIDYRQEKNQLLLADQNSVRSFSAGRGDGFKLLSRVLAEIKTESLPQGVAVVLPGLTEQMPWSDARAAVSLGNSLAFAWDVPVVRLRGDEGDLVAVAIQMLRETKSDVWISALYDGEPNITKPKA
jgi:hypothetical protein